jgi:hypothetical protein
LLATFLAAAAIAAEPGIRMEFIGGTVPGIAVKARVRLDITVSEAIAFQSEKLQFQIAFSRINTIEYGQNVSRRYAAAILISPLLLLSKSRKHYLTLGYLDSEDKQQAMVFRVEKGDIRAMLAGLEARTGRRVEYQDQEARKAGKE